MHDALADFRVALLAGDFEQASRLAQDVIAREGESALWLNELGQLHFTQGHFDEALQHFDRAASLDPHFVEALLNGAVVLADLGYYDEAAARFEAACALDTPEESPLGVSRPAVGVGGLPPSLAREVAAKHLDIAQLHLEFERLDAAEAEARSALETQPGLAPAHLVLARVHMHREQLDAALLELEQARRHAPKDSRVQLLAAQCYVILRRATEAREALARAELLQDKSTTGAVLRHAYGATGSH